MKDDDITQSSPDRTATSTDQDGDETMHIVNDYLQATTATDSGGSHNISADPMIPFLPHDAANHHTAMITSYTLIGKYGKDKKFIYDDLDGEVTIGEVKEMIFLDTNILPKRQKLVGLVAKTASKNAVKGLHDEIPISELKMNKSSTMTKTTTTTIPSSTNNSSTASAVKENATRSNNHDNNTNAHLNMEIITHHFIIMGTPEESIFIDPEERRLRMMQNDGGGGGAIDDVIDDFDLECNAGSDEWYSHVTNEENLKKFTENTPIYIMNDPRPNKLLLVLDLDHTLLDFSRKPLLYNNNTNNENNNTEIIIQNMKRPYLDEFLTNCYQYYDIVIWSQTSWRWLETKLIELGLINHPSYKICFVLDKTSMFTITSTLKTRSSSRPRSAKPNSNNSVTHHVKPLQIIWNKFNDRWNSANTIHIDDLSRNFALNMKNGLKIKPYYRKKASSGRNDMELIYVCRYLLLLAQHNIPFHHVNIHKWYDVVLGNVPFIETITDKNAKVNLLVDDKDTDETNEKKG